MAEDALTIPELITILLEVANNPDPIERAKRWPEMSKAAQGATARARAEDIERAKALPNMTYRRLAAELGIHESKLYKSRARHLPVTPS